MVLSTGSVSTSAFLTPRSFRSMPTSRVTPTPKRTLDTAISNAVSFSAIVDAIVDVRGRSSRSLRANVMSGAGADGRWSGAEHRADEDDQVVDPQRLERKLRAELFDLGGDFLFD